MDSDGGIVESVTRRQYEELLPQTLALFSAAFGRETTAEFLKWRYLANPALDVLACIERLKDDSLAASYSASPVLLCRDGQPLRSAVSMTTMTAPKFAGKGLFTKLASRLYEDMRSRDYDLVWGFPNANSHYGFVSKLQWSDIYEIPTMSVGLSEVNRARLPIGIEEVRSDDEFLLDYGAIAQSKTERITVKRSAEYLRWRYSDHPENVYSVFCTGVKEQVSSYCITKVYQASAIDIVDMWAATPDEMSLLLSKVVQIGEAASLRRINCWAPRHDLCHRVYERLGFLLGAPITYFGARLLSSKHIQPSEAQNYSNWYIQMGDSDVY